MKQNGRWRFALNRGDTPGTKTGRRVIEQYLCGVFDIGGPTTDESTLDALPAGLSAVKSVGTDEIASRLTGKTSDARYLWDVFPIPGVPRNREAIRAADMQILAQFEAFLGGPADRYRTRSSD